MVSIEQNRYLCQRMEIYKEAMEARECEIVSIALIKFCILWFYSIRMFDRFNLDFSLAMMLMRARVCVRPQSTFFVFHA